MIKIEKKQNCCGCKVCGDICPKEAISFFVDSEGFWYPKVIETNCINCGLCEAVCPELISESILDKQQGMLSDVSCYAAEHKNIDVVFSSTTGGAFSALAEVMYSNNGFVCGAIHDEDFFAVEYISNNKEDLGKLRRSKDLQSDSAGIYKRIKSLLDAGEKVLFCGVPCQVAALRCFLKKEYENLITVDLICLGVNSPKVWKKYLEYIEAQNGGAKIVYTENKSKEFGWNKLTQKFIFENGEESFDTVETSPFIKGFIKSHLYCRPSCYECKFKGFPRYSDITIGDYWGIQKHDKTYSSNMGTSLIIVNTEKGVAYFEKAKKRMKIKETPLKWAMAGNPALTKSITKLSSDRNAFFEALDKDSFDNVVAYYAKQSQNNKQIFIQWIRKKILFLKKVIVNTQMNPKALWQTLYYSGIRNLLKQKGIICCPHCIIKKEKNSKIFFDGTFILGCKGRLQRSRQESRLYIGEGATLKILGDFYVERDCDIEIFESATLIIHGKKYLKSDANTGLTIICGDLIEIGADVGIGRNVTIRDTNGNHFINVLGYKSSKPIKIYEKAWLCESCTIMPGVTIGRSAIVSVNSTVTKSVPEHSLVSGFPATVIQENVIWKY